jgi:hypothetical protein
MEQTAQESQAEINEVAEHGDDNPTMKLTRRQRSMAARKGWRRRKYGRKQKSSSKKQSSKTKLSKCDKSGANNYKSNAEDLVRYYTLQADYAAHVFPSNSKKRLDMAFSSNHRQFMQAYYKRKSTSEFFLLSPSLLVQELTNARHHFDTDKVIFKKQMTQKQMDKLNLKLEEDMEEMFDSGQPAHMKEKANRLLQYWNMQASYAAYVHPDNIKARLSMAFSPSHRMFMKKLYAGKKVPKKDNPLTWAAMPEHYSLLSKELRDARRIFNTEEYVSRKSKKVKKKKTSKAKTKKLKVNIADKPCPPGQHRRQTKPRRCVKDTHTSHRGPKPKYYRPVQKEPANLKNYDFTYVNLD